MMGPGMGLDQLVLRDHVGVEEDHDIAGAAVCPQIAGSCQTEPVTLLAEDPDIKPLGKHRCKRWLTSIVDNEDLGEFRGVGLLGQRLEQDF